MSVEIEKRPGWDWVCLYQMFDSPTEELHIFGAMSFDEALRDAIADLTACELLGQTPNYQIFAIIRSDHYAAMKGEK